MKTILLILTSLIIGLGIGWFIFSSAGHPENHNQNMEVVSQPEADNVTISMDPSVIQKMNVRTDSVRFKTLSGKLRTVGSVAVNETRQYSINSKISGWVEKLYADYSGKLITKNQPLLEIYSPELVSTQEEYIQSVIHEQHLENSTLAEAKSGAASLSESAKRRLQNWDISDAEIKHLADTEEIKKTLILHAPSGGYVMEKMVVQGQSIEAGMELFKISDLSTVWILADVYQQDLSRISVNQAVSVELSYLPGRKIAGKITFIYPTLNEETKTGKIRIEVQNTPQLDFKPGMFASVEINSNTMEKSLVVDEQSIIRTGKKTIVIVSLGDGKFEAKEVETGISSDGLTEIKNGLHENEIYVTSSQFLIDSESNIKAAINQLLSHQHQTSHLTNSTNEADKMQSRKVGKSVWVCPMHPDIVRDKPGHCPKCNMTLVEKKL